MLLKGKIAIVTGGSRGIGFATVEAFLAEGATVVLCGSRPESAQKAVAQLKERIPMLLSPESVPTWLATTR